MVENTAEQMDDLLDAEGRRRRKDRPVVEKKRHPLETVPFFDRPMGASIKDAQVGEDDIGNPVFKTKLGDTYTVRLNPDQRTTRTKIEEDVLPAVKQYLQDPQLPTKEQVVGAGKAVAGAIKETVSTPKKLLTGEKSAADVTMGDVFDTAGMMAIGSAPFKVPEDSLRLFGGINIKGATERKNLNKAVKLLDKSDWTHKSGPVPYNLNKKIWEKTGWYVDPTDGQWRIHIDDSDSFLKSFEDAFKIESGQVTFKELGEYPLPKDQSKKVKLAEILDHKNLYTRYPDLKDLDVNFYSDIKKRETLGSADGEKIYINLAAFEKYGDMKSTILHEIQHIIQDKEGFVPGSSTAKIPNELVENKVQEIKQKKTPLNVKKAVAEKKLEDLIAKRDKEAEQLYKKISTKDFDSVDEELLPQLEKDIRDTKSELTKTIKDLYELDKEAFDLEFQFYRGAGGEIESRLVQKMADDSVGEFPIGVRSSMLKEEGQNFQYRGSQGVDPFQYTPTERRNPEKLRPFHLDFLKRNRTSSSSEAPKDLFTNMGEQGALEEFSDIGKLVDKYVMDTDFKSINQALESKDYPAYRDVLKTNLKDTFGDREINVKRIEGYSDPFSKKKETSFRINQDDVLFVGNPDEKELIIRDSDGKIKSVMLDSTKSESVARYSDKVEPEVYDAFVELADIQRGAPEVAMTKAQFDLGGGVLGYALEHTGDLTHRMAEYGGRFGDEYVKPKIDRIFNLLTNDYGFEKEVKENLLSNIKYQFQTEKPNISLKEYEKQYREKVSKSLKKYADEHKKVPVYNDMQLAGREAAIAMGEGRYDDALENIYIIKKAIDEGNYSERSLEFDPKIDFRKPKEFAEGGVAMKDQMEMAFMQEGGLKDDGMDIDPVSGNEVPPGSMAKEVRDDIPAQLSEGEYVVPADVVQYYGVKFFEDLRMEAKRGLADMEANGRIGGEPVDMPMDDTPTVAVSTGGYIDGIPAAEYNVGGMASNLYNNPTQMDQEVNNIISTMYNNPQVMDELARRGIQVNRTQAQMMPQQMNQANPPSQARMGMNPGGLTGNESEAAAYNYITSPTIPGPMFQTPGASYIYAAPPQMTTTAQQEATPSVEYCDKIGMDYDPDMKMCVPRAVTEPSQAGGDDDGPPETPKVDGNKWMEKFDYSGTDEGMQNLLQQSLDLLDPPERTGLGGAVSGMLDNTFLGKFNAGSNAAQVAANIIILDHYGVDTTELTNKWKSYTDANLGGVPKPFYNGDMFAKQAAIKHGLSLSLSAEDPNGNKIFKGRDDYRKFLENEERKENIRRRYKGTANIAGLGRAGEILERQQKEGLNEQEKAAQKRVQEALKTSKSVEQIKKPDAKEKQRRDDFKSSLENQMEATRARAAAAEAAKREGLDPKAKRGGRNKGGLMKKKKK